MTVQDLVCNALEKDASSVWRLKDHDKFGYSDGAQSEQYLEDVFRACEDLSTTSDELVRFMKDWPSEYHLSPKRAQLLSGFSFDRSARVLEVGCGCGAITRHLGENFDEVVSIEGSMARARLAHLRTRDLSSVSIMCAPFQEVQFKEKFDLIFVVGVYEYSGLFVGGDDPYQAVLAQFSDLLHEDGAIVVAIENQFGLKYFNGCREDHIGQRYQGLEGYHRGQHGVRTFGRGELKTNLKRYFSDVQFYYPFPDYKMPDCVLSEDALASPRSGELVAGLSTRKNDGPDLAVWEEPATVLELARNGMLPDVANSFLVVAGKQKLDPSIFDQLGIVFAPGRRSRWRVETRITKTNSGAWLARKTGQSGQQEATEGPLRWVPCSTPWQDRLSMHTELALLAMRPDATLDEIFSRASTWAKKVKSDAHRDARGRWMVQGAHLDRIWQNFYAAPSDADSMFIDQEWVWHEDIPLNVLVVRAIYQFLNKVAVKPGGAECLKVRSGRRLVAQIADVFGFKLNDRDFADFIRLESELSAAVFGSDPEKLKRQLQWFLRDRASQQVYQRVRPKIAARLRRLHGAADTLINKVRHGFARTALSGN